VEERWKSNVEYKGFSIQRKTGKEASGLVYWFIFHQQSSFYQCGQTMTAYFNENSPSCEYQSDSMI